MSHQPESRTEKFQYFQYFVNTYGDWLYRASVLLAFTAILWLNQHYVTKTSFKEEIVSLKKELSNAQLQISGRIDALTSSVNSANTAIAVAQQRQLEIDDLKMRVRDLERDARTQKN